MGMELLIQQLRRDVGSSGQHSSRISKRGVGGARGWSVAWTEPKTSEGLVSLFGIYSSGCKRLLNRSEMHLIHSFLLLQLFQGEE